MTSLSRLVAAFHARNLEFWRDRGTFIWNIFFPFIVVIGFAFAFTGKGQDLFKVAWLGPEAASGAPSVIGAEEFFQVPHVQFVHYDDERKAFERLRHHQVDLVVGPGAYWVNASSPKGQLLERILRGTERERGGLERRTVEGREIRYVDWLISGLLGMNMMFSALFGVGFVIVRYRKNGVLKRLRATPLTAFEFLASQVLSRLLVIVIVSALVYGGCYALVGFTMLGSYATLILVNVLGAMCLISVGLCIAAFVRSEELAGGILNLLSWPMMFFSGVWFSLEGAQPWLQKAAKIFPLTHLIEASRAIMTEGATLAEVRPQVLILAATTLVCLSLGAWLFRWE
jgi:ABC-2 type transport system permease protein